MPDRHDSETIEQMPVSWQLPALPRMLKQLSGERTVHGLLVLIIALALWPAGFWLSYLIILTIPALTAICSQFNFPDWLVNILTPLGAAVSVGLWVPSTGTGLLMPVLICLWAATTFQRTYKAIVADLLNTWVLLTLVDSEYTRILEEERHEHFKLVINPLRSGREFSTRLHYFSAYYSAFRQMSASPCEPSVPAVNSRNCWLEGAFACLSGCFNVCAGLGIFLAIPLMVRIVLTWSRQLAVEQAVLDYFGGKFEAVLEQRYQNAQSLPPAEQPAVHPS